jgi:hypothetical protein
MGNRVISRRLLGFTVAFALGGFGLFGAPANAGDCTVNLPDATCDGSCLVNANHCDSNGTCDVNTGYCDGACTVNTGTCNTGATCTVNLGTCNGNVSGSPDPQGRKCRFVSNTDVTAEAQTQSGEADAGPLVLSAAATLSCVIYVNGVPQTSVSAHSVDADPVHVATVAGIITYHSNVTDIVDECTVVAYDAGPTIYWHPGPYPGTGSWSSDSNPSRCGAAITIDINPEVCPFLLAIDARANTNLAEIWQDCEPYSPFI